MMLFISGLTGVGKSTTLKALRAIPGYTLLPNRRELTDQIIIPEVLRDEGKELQAVKNRLERFRLTAEYRKKYPTGIVQALQTYLATLPEGHYIFDNIRGLEECQAAVNRFPEARIIFLDAPALVRLKRLLGRNDSFDAVRRSKNTGDLRKQLRNIEDIQEVFNLDDLMNLRATGLEDGKLLDAVQIILAEHKNYNATQAAQYLKHVLGPRQLLYLDTSQSGIEQVAQSIERWL